jgi:ADP-ribose pyrophosphatase
MQHKQEDDGHLRELTKDSTLVLDGHFLKVKRDTVILPDGKETTREYILHPGAVVIIPLMNDGRVLVERQFRYPLNKGLSSRPGNSNTVKIY